MPLEAAPPLPDVDLAEDVDFSGHRIRFDNFSHRNRKQRAYATCRNTNHPRCFRYTTVSNHESARHCVAYLCAWSARSDLETKDEHKDFAPSPDEIQHWLRQLP
eukprot:1235703-Pyramimonas_sp.AAC.1